MKFRQHQEQAQQHTLRLFIWFGVLLMVLTVAINLFLALAYKLVMPFGVGYPNLFFETNTAVIVLFVIGGAWVETQRLKEGGGPRIAHWMGGREVIDPDDALERRLVNVVDELAIASGQPVPRVYVLPKEDAINAFVAGWDANDTVMCVTQGALDRLNRAELQGLIAHEYGHIKEKDLALCMRLIALVWGLSLVHGYGQQLMARDERGQIRPPMWLMGLVFSVIGWLGWVAGRLLQAAVSRQREYLADASAIQFTRSRDGLGNVLRKVWHDQEVLAGRMRSARSEMIAALLMHDGAHSTWLATHPRLQDRIHRICGAVLPPLPAPLIRLEVTEPRRAPRPAATLAAAQDLNGHHHGPARSMPAHASQTTQATPTRATPFHQSTEEAEHQERLQRDQDAWARLKRLYGPTEQRLAVLALMLNPDNQKELTLWGQLAEAIPHGPQILCDVLDLQPQRRAPEFERLCTEVANRPLEEKRVLVETARDLLRVDGRVSPKDRLWWMALRHRMGVQAILKKAYARTATGAGHDLSALQTHEMADVASLTAYLARLVPVSEQASGPMPAAKQWYAAVMSRCNAPEGLRSWTQGPDADALAHAIHGIQEMSWMLRPILMRAWVEEALNHSKHGILSQDTADALRITAGLIESPLPPVLESHYQI